MSSGLVAPLDSRVEREISVTKQSLQLRVALMCAGLDTMED